jgi:DNA-binding protein YbaB
LSTTAFSREGGGPDSERGSSLEERLAEASRLVAEAEEDFTNRVAEFHQVQAVGYSQHNLVKAVVKGVGRVEDLIIDPEVVETYDAESVAYLVLEAIAAGCAELDTRVGEDSEALLAEMSRDQGGW